MANTTWNPSDKSAALTLTGGNLIATGGLGINSVRAIDKQITGKFYWECAFTTSTSLNTGVGVWSPSVPQGSQFATVTPGMCGLPRSGGVLIDGGASSFSFGTIAVGTVVCIAFDAGSRLIWFRLGAAGNWNNSASANPTTGVGGVSTPNLGVAIPAYPAMVSGISGDQVTANFGDSAFTGTVPSGFTSGFTAGAVVPTNELLTQAAVEQWVSIIPPQLRLTQGAIEQWATVSAAGSNLIFTQGAVEEWASIRLASLSSGAMLVGL
jgi:hypothetical protein